jgi:hypothetical protein
MKHVCAAVLAAALGAGQAAALAPQDDDWEFQEDAAQGVSVAAVRYDAGQMIIAQCREGRLTVVLSGLSQTSEQLRVAATRGDGRAAEQRWVATRATGAWRSASPGRDARFLRGAGNWSFRNADPTTPAFTGVFELPAQSANLDRVLTACGWALEDDRDLLVEAEVLLDRPRRGQAPAAHRYRAPNKPEREVSCVVRGMRLRDCRADHPRSTWNADVRSVIQAVEGEEVYVAEGVEASTMEGRVFHAVASDQLLIVVSR